MINKTFRFGASAALSLLLSQAALADETMTTESSATKQAAEETESAATLEAASFAESESSTQEAETEAEIQKDADKSN